MLLIGFIDNPLLDDRIELIEEIESREIIFFSRVLDFDFEQFFFFALARTLYVIVYDI